MKKEIKFVSAERFTQSTINPQVLIDSDQFYPQILLPTARSIGAGLNWQNVFSVTHISFLASVIDMAQEMGRCSWGTDSRPGEFHMLLSLNDFVYLNQQLHLPQDPVSEPIKPLLSKEEEIKMQRDNLLDLMKMIVLQGSCWYIQSESCISNPCKPLSQYICTCDQSCPVCLKDIDTYITPINRRGMCIFLLMILSIIHQYRWLLLYPKIS